MFKASEVNAFDNEFEVENRSLFNEHGPVILCSGGFGADFTSNSLLAQYRPDLMHSEMRLIFIFV